MLANKNYQWIWDWNQNDDESSMLPKTLYWTRLYNKLYSQGRAKDKACLRKLYDKRQKDRSSSFLIGFMERIVNPYDCYRYACIEFINKLRAEDSHDDVNKQAMINRTIADNAYREFRNSIYGCDVDKYEREITKLEAECEKNHTDYHRNFKYVGNNMLPEQPKPLDSLMQPIIKSGFRDYKKFVCKIQENYMANEKITVYYRVHDKVGGFYGLEIFTDSPYDDYFDEAKTQPKMTLIYGKHLSKAHNGLLTMKMLDKYLNQKAEFIADRMRNGKKTSTVTLNPNRMNANPTKSNRRGRQKSQEPDISKINKALGLEETEDLNGNIF